MLSSENVFSQAGIQLQNEDVKVVLLEDEDSIIQKYLDEGTFIDSRNSKDHERNMGEPNRDQDSDIPCQAQSKPKRQMTSKNSIFHNFQKHLITIIKKLVHINEATFEGYECGALAEKLWAAFLNCKGQSKKIFHLIFGVASHASAEHELAKLAEAFPTFQPLLAEHSTLDIECAQELIRVQVSSQMRQFSKLQICSKCRVHKWQQFYEYFRAFTHQLLQGQLNNRITKSQKEALIVKLYSQSKLAA